MKRICIITPGQLGSNPRVVKEAQTLSEHGYRVDVIATKVADFVEPRDQAVLAQAKYSVHRISFSHPLRRRMCRARQLIARQLWGCFPSTQLAIEAQSFMSRRLINAALATPADLYIAHYVAALPAAVAAARRHGAVYAFDAEDFHLGDLPEAPEHIRARRLIESIESRYLPHAAYVSAASPGIANAYTDRYAISPPVVILNTFSKTLSASFASSPDSHMRAPSVYWFSQTIGPCRGLEGAVDAIAQAQSAPHLHLRGTPSKGYAEMLRARAFALGVGNRLHIHEPGKPDEMVAMASLYDVGLVGETRTTFSRSIALTNKQFTYLLAGLPAIMSDLPAHKAYAAEAEGAAFLYRSEDARSLSEALDALFVDRTRLAAAKRRAHLLGQSKFNWEAEAPKLLRCVERALARFNHTTPTNGVL